MSTYGISTDANLTIEMNDITFNQVNYVSRGILMDFRHQLPNEISIIDVTVRRVNRGYINIEGSSANIPSSMTRVKIEQSSFNWIFISLSSFIEISEGAQLRVDQSNFRNNANMNTASGLMNVITGSTIEITNTLLERNSAYSSSLFNIMTESLVICRNCSISQNFAIYNGIIHTSINGRFELYG